ncbi:YolD-like family protein [Salicibibacter cibarius]|uniref:YolD-like family protein n=1 Tax=Salicibibacter cibarius TaxID=2743000 RepID=A0A7T7CAF6_9BACI|nr:YolD-like family protein [Salicibibacter cibarius]QQK74849.1 YolD-like family protein [Salicibibacter cibarius]
MNKLTPGSNLRWESSRMILPEHREQWLKHQQETRKAKKPMLDEQRWLEFEFVISEAMASNEPVKFIYWENGEFFDLIGHCHYINTDQQQFHIVCTQSDIHYLKFEKVVSMELTS